MEISLNMAQGGSFYRSAQNAGKVNKAVNSMLNRLDTGEKYQFAYENVGAVIEGSSLAGRISAGTEATDRNKKAQQELDPLMKAQTEIMNMLGTAKEVGEKFNALSVADRTTGTGVALTTQHDELVRAISSLASNTSFKGDSITSGVNQNLSVNAANASYTFSTGGFAFSGTVGNTADIDAAISSMGTSSAISGVFYKNVLGGFNNVMTTDVNAMSSRRSDLVVADDNETMAILSTLNSRMDAISASRQYSAQYRGNSMALNIFA